MGMDDYAKVVMAPGALKGVVPSIKGGARVVAELRLVGFEDGSVQVFGSANLMQTLMVLTKAMGAVLTQNGGD